MEEQNSPLFGLSIDTSTRLHFSEAAKWAKFLAIVGFVFCSLFVIAAFFMGTIITAMTFPGDEIGRPRVNTGGLGIFITVLYLGVALLVFLPYLFLFRFAVNMKTALAMNEQDSLNKSAQNLKIMFRYVGILTIIGLCFYGLSLLILLASLPLRS